MNFEGFVSCLCVISFLCSYQMWNGPSWPNLLSLHI